MNSKKTVIIIAVVLCAAGAILCGLTFKGMHYNLGALNTSEYVTNEYEVKDGFDKISINADTEDIAFVPSEGKDCKVVCYENTDDLHDVRVESSTLKIGKRKNNNFVVNIGIYTETPTVTVYLPESEYDSVVIDSDTGDVMIPEDFIFGSISVTLDTGDIDISASALEKTALQTDTGKVNLHDMSADSILVNTSTGHNTLNNVTVAKTLEINVSTGKLDFSNVTCADLKSDGTTGRVNLSNVNASGEFRITRSTGSISFDKCDAGSICVETDTGDIEGTLTSDKVFYAQSDTGDVEVPKSTTGGMCEMTTDTGDIRISIS